MSKMLYIINLKKRKDRKLLMVAQLKKYGITNYKFINAVNGYTLNKYGKNLKTMDWDLIDKYITDLKSRNIVDVNVGDMYKGNYKYPLLKSGEIGCYLSHILVFLDALKHKYNQITVFEDDVEILDPKHLFDNTPGITYLGIAKGQYKSHENKDKGLVRVDGINVNAISTKNKVLS